MFTYTETPIKDLWEHLKFLSVENNCKRLLNGQIKSNRTLIYTNDEIIDRKAKQISMCIKQAHEYFVASESVSINTSPLLLFYGMLSLAKGLIIANKEETFLDNIKYHGLETRPRYNFLSDYIEDESKWKIEKEYAVTNSGVFSHLTEILDDFSFPEHSVIEFQNIIKCIPELHGIYEKYYSESSNILDLYSYKIIKEPSYKLKLFIQGTESTEMLKVIPELENDFTISDKLYQEQSVEFISKELTSIPDYIGIISPQAGGCYLIKGLEYYNGHQTANRFVSMGILDYIGMYILSICVRYKQVLWRQIISGETSGSISLIELYISSMKRRFPNIILDKMFNEQFAYGTTGYF